MWLVTPVLTLIRRGTLLSILLDPSGLRLLGSILLVRSDLRLLGSLLLPRYHHLLPLLISYKTCSYSGRLVQF
jgi:hypothetical protein